MDINEVKYRKENIGHLLRHIEDQVGKGHYSNALATALTLAQDLHWLWANAVRYPARPKE